MLTYFPEYRLQLADYMKHSSEVQLKHYNQAHSKGSDAWIASLSQKLMMNGVVSEQDKIPQIESNKMSLSLYLHPFILRFSMSPPTPNN